MHARQRHQTLSAQLVPGQRLDLHPAQAFILTSPSLSGLLKDYTRKCRPQPC